MTSGLLAMPVALLRQLGGRKNLEYANLHVEVIRSFGRFPTAIQCSAARQRRRRKPFSAGAVCPAEVCLSAPQMLAD
jgi:hypothetical protein